MFVLLGCWYDGDSCFIEDSFVACSECIESLVDHANREGDCTIARPEESLPDDGCYGDKRRRFRIVKTILVDGLHRLP